MPRPIFARVNVAALAHNLAVARRHAAGARILAVLKANAYGHGLARAAQAMQDADGFAVLDLNEAIALRDAHPDKPVLMLEGVFQAADVPVAAAHRIHLVVHSPEQFAMLRATRPPGSLDVFLKLNSGMNRLGFSPAEYRKVFGEVKSIPWVRSVGLMTHFADADGAAGIDVQLERFNALTVGLPGDRTVSNSAALLRYSGRGFDWVRPGIMLYGCSPFADRSAESLGLLPAMSLITEIIGIQKLEAGDKVGYGGAFVARQAMRIGVIACGYADGYPRHASSGTPILVGGRRTRTVGRVSMDMIVVDLTDLPEARVGTQATLWGEGLSADEVAAAAGTISYELLCAVAPRVRMIEAA
ncbi:MAG: alanine racemase [Burkholderiales bacterium]